MTSNVVVGKRVTGESGMPAGLTMYIVAALLVVLAVRSFAAHDSTFGGLYVFGALVAALVARTFRGDAKRTSDILSSCPVCDVERQRSFMAVRDEREVTTACEACIAYLRVNLDSLAVTEEPADATGGTYSVSPAQYSSVTPSALQMPTMCAVCGASPAPLLRTLDPVTEPDAGVIGAVASGVATEVAYETNILRADRRYGSNTPSPGAELDFQLGKLEMHVCEKHTSITARGCEYDDGTIFFGSYRYYKAFCELNHIKAKSTLAEPAETPTARVVSS